VTDFHERYASALDEYLATLDERSLAVGHELGRRALQERISALDIIEHHSRLVRTRDAAESAAALQFLLQTLATLDVAIRGFLEGNERYEQQRARADDLADRDEFRSALVNSLQEGFFVADRSGAVVEVNDAFAEMTGYGTDGLPCPSPYPWVIDMAAAEAQLAALARDGSITAETRIRRRDGAERLIAIAINAVTAPGSERHAYVGTIRDITATRALAERERVMARLATAVSVARGVDEVLSITLAQCRAALDVARVMAVVWPHDETEPIVHVAGHPAVANWQELEEDWRRTFEDARDWLPLAVAPVGAAPSAGTTRGFVAVLTGARDVVLCLEHRVPRRISQEDRQLVTAMVGQLSLAMQHVRQFETARETSLTLQRSMLPPSDLPAGFAVRYEPAVPPLEIGGDFYDVLSLGDDRIGVTVGDCVGRGLSAAAVMGQLRASTRALLLAGTEPARLLEQLDSVAEFIPDAFCTTVFVGIIDPVAQTIRYSSAGHVPPVLVTDSGARRLLTDAHSVPLAVQRTAPRPQASQPLEPGSTLMLYTDGLVERRDEPIDDQIDRAATVLVDTVGQPAENIADAVLDRMAPTTGFDDDVACVLYRSVGALLVLDYDATPDRLRDVRHRLTEWLCGNAVSKELTADVILVVNEACTNCVEHAYREPPAGRMRIEGTVRDGRLRIRVADFGSWKRPPADPGTRGRGLPLIRAMSDSVNVDGTPDGTSVEIAFALPSN
jgi:PAS domain S-box-containing protein